MRRLPTCKLYNKKKIAEHTYVYTLLPVLGVVNLLYSIDERVGWQKHGDSANGDTDEDH